MRVRWGHEVDASEPAQTPDCPRCAVVDAGRAVVFVGGADDAAFGALYHYDTPQ